MGYAGAALGAAAVPAIVPASVFGQPRPSNRIHVGFIGCGNQSTIDLPAFLGQDDVQVVAVCDVNTRQPRLRSPSSSSAASRPRRRSMRTTPKKSPPGQYKGCDAYNDFREVLARRDIDAVAIVVPDHWHALMTVHGGQGRQGHLLRKAAVALRRPGPGDGQGRAQAQADPADRQPLPLQPGRAAGLRAGPQRPDRQAPADHRLRGRATTRWTPGPGWKPMPVPEGFDYECWLGPAPRAPYHKDRCFYRFRFNLDYSGGQTTNFGAHSNDIAQWALGTDHTGPVEFEDAGSEWPPQGRALQHGHQGQLPRPLCQRRRAASATPSKPGFGARFEGTEGWVQYGYGGVTSQPASLKTSVIGPDEIHCR